MSDPIVWRCPILPLILLLFLGLESKGQEKIISGKVLDSLTRLPLVNVSVRIKGSGKGTLTDAGGNFRLAADKNTGLILVSLVGYAPKSFPLGAFPEGRLTIPLSKSYTDLEDVLVKIQKHKYRNKNNPAVELIREVIQHKAENELGAYAFATYRKYDKTVLSMDNLPHRFTDARLLHRYHFLFENVDSTKVPGKRLIPLYIAEAFSDEYSRAHPERRKSLVLGQKSVNYGEYVDMKGISSLLKWMYGDVDIYKDRINLFGTQLLSPISDAAPTFYMYFILDTLHINGVPVVKMTYMPRNPDDLLFRGTLYIPLDGHYSIQQADLGVSRHINLNFVRSFKVSVNYTRDSAGSYYLSRSDMLADLGIFQRGFGMYGERLISNTGFRTAPKAPDSVFRGLPIDSAAQASHPPDTLWNTARSVPLSRTETTTYQNIDSLQNMPAYRRLMDIITMFVSGYKSAGPFNIGPIYSFYSYNPVEGFKPRFGGRTTPKFSNTFYAEGYAAYGFLDRQLKYALNLSYSFNHRSIFNYFPLHYLQAGYQWDTDVPGQLNNFSSTNTFQSSFTQGPNDQWLYNRLFHLYYLQEFLNHFSYNLGYQYWKQQPAGTIEYLYQKPAGGLDTVREITTSSLSATLRWAPHEQFFLSQTGRSDIINQYPIITLSYARGVKGLAGGEYNYNALNLTIYRRFFVAPFGFTDVTLSSGYISGKLPFPLLFIPPANETYVYYPNAYNLMNFEEFVSDHYAGLNFDHYFNGFFFNKIPWLKWLKLREVVEAKILFGGVRAENNPDLNPEQMKFPTINGATSAFVLNGQPYVEAGVGITNIFKILRVDLVRRMTYLSHPYASSWGLRLCTQFNF